VVAAVTAYYNEIDPYAAQWLRNLISAGHIAPGDVDERSITEVHPDDVRGYTQCHFFAGIGGWSLALRLAGWPDDRPAWTGSCPCQPFSTAGKRKGTADERHLWPAWFHLIEQCRPTVIFGEQTASPDGYAWLDIVWSDMEAAGYAFAPVVLPAAGFGAPHGRHRIYFVADANGARLEGRGGVRERADQCAVGARRLDGGLADAAVSAGVGGKPRGIIRELPQVIGAMQAGCQSTGPVNGFWRDADWLLCRDGKWRPVEPGSFPLVDGAAARVGRLRAYGNAIVPQVAAEFIAAYLDALRDATG
jgi:DNA (cytosine-5)-methyltransferase 1